MLSTLLPLTLAAGLFTACGDGSPTLVGTVQGELSTSGGNFDLYVNGRQTSVYVDQQGGFGTDGLPTGDVEIAIAGPSFSGAIVIHDVQMGELLEIEVKVSAKSLTIRLKRRQPNYYSDGNYGKSKYKYKCKSDNPFDGCVDDDSDSDSSGGFNPFR